MPGLIEEIQSAALDPTLRISDLLRKVKLAAVKLKLNDADAWVDNELKGYPNAASLPDYRLARGNLRIHNRFHGPQPLGGDPDAIEQISRAYITESVGSLESLLQDQQGSLVFKLPQALINAIHKANGGPYSEIYNHLPPSTIPSILDRVRTMVLDWAIALEGAGVVGEGISFSMEEKERAERLAGSIQINNFGNFHNGNITGDQNRSLVSSNDRSTNSSSINVFEQLRGAITTKIESSEDRKGLTDLVERLEQTKGTSEYQGIYQKFITSAAAYMTILGPFIPALTEYLPKL